MLASGKWSVGIVVLVTSMMLLVSSASAQDASSLEFDLPSVNGESVELSAGMNPLTVICFVGNECPLALHYARRLSAMQVKLKADKVRFIGINSNQQDRLDECKSFAKELQLEFELAKDHGNIVADKFGATRTPEVFLLDASLNVVYQGRIDDQYSPGTNRTSVSTSFLRDAIKSQLADKPIAIPSTEPEGCLIGRKKEAVESPTVTYSNQISRLLQKQCVECHRNGEIGPFALDNYDEAVGWAEMMVEVVDNERMPPWHATDEHADFVNERKLSDSEKQLFRDWLEQGAPFGAKAELPEPQQFVDGWRLPKMPDKVVSMRTKPFVVPATGTVEYQYFVVDPGFESDTWVYAAEVIPGNRSVVHHSIVFIRPPE